MSDFNAESMKAIAERVYPEHTWWLHHEDEVICTVIGGEDSDEVLFFSPSLTGNERERAQALDCIVAADKLPGCFLCDAPNNSNILTAAMAAILRAKK
jgi:hypothetical protein